ncbi:MAG: 16S rRNA (uracil(1498)-N(3))-methyltransferase [Bacteroidales bacterium]|jgi:16S rRNA (uracil1498-N3)-methyltransferase|nr:16S rRNA (uracil(1498)-N(3))-methyltransferase [Bacteroidales bacterium]MCK9498807.1 16S rRNA (uracil(1498)-N(3))-methyltransferase [Bacteroidales bacterium]MDY0313977.1 16S rRNA (uracil(1498)-N(3))-methyltransferase [Bacteroidales bacterium]NLB86471.1 16S rRNA (uracil(1498)-N(3))-methyltransferase [Bacteroidales bacterium]
MYLFYDKNISGNFHVLNEEESKHCVKVLRLNIGDEVFLTDGLGNLYKTIISEIYSKKVILKIIEHTENYEKRNYNLHIAIAPTKMNERFEWFVEKSVEIGIDEITPIICKNSERKIVKNDRLNRVAQAAMKQSYKAYHPQINEYINLEIFLNKNLNYQHKFIAHCFDIAEKQYLASILNKNSSYLILIGPEGDFTQDEIKLCKNAGFKEISLGKSRLRTETAGVVACNIVSVINSILL